MSERDLKPIQVLTEVLAGRRTVVSAAAVLALGVRQTFRLLARYQEGGGGALVHKARGRTSNNCFTGGFQRWLVFDVRVRSTVWKRSPVRFSSIALAGGTVPSSSSKPDKDYL